MKTRREGLNLVVFTCETKEEREWLETNAYADAWQWMGLDSLAVDIRAAPALVDGLREEGFKVE